MSTFTFNKKATDWVVYGQDYGAIYEIDDPSDPVLASKEADLAGPGRHLARRRRDAEELANAFAAGRLFGHRQADEQRARGGLS